MVPVICDEKILTSMVSEGNASYGGRDSNLIHIPVYPNNPPQIPE
jgi:hypothetical protein